MIKIFLNPKGHQNPISGSKVTAILLTGWILPVGGASAGRVCACSPRSRLVYSEGRYLGRALVMPSSGTLESLFVSVQMLPICFTELYSVEGTL